MLHTIKMRTKKSVVKDIQPEDVPVTKAMLELTEKRLEEKIESAKLELKSEIGSVRTELRAEIGTVRTELRAEIGTARTELRAEIGTARTELGAEIGSVKSELQAVKAAIHDVKSEVHRLAILIEEQNARNKIVLEGLTGLFQRQDRIEKRTDEMEMTLANLRSIAPGRS